MNEIVWTHEHILEVHGFYLDDDARTISLDVVISFDEPHRASAAEAIREEIQAAFPDSRHRLQQLNAGAQSGRCKDGTARARRLLRNGLPHGQRERELAGMGRDARCYARSSPFSMRRCVAKCFDSLPVISSTSSAIICMCAKLAAICSVSTFSWSTPGL